MLRPAWLLSLSLLLVSGAALAGGPGSPAPSVADESADDIPGELAVDFADDLPPGRISELLARLAVTFAPSALEADTRVQVVRVVQERLDEVRGALEKDSRVEVVEPHARVRALFVPNDPLLKDQWHLTRVGAERAWDFSTGRGATVAVIDTGIACERFEHFDKASDLAKTRCVAGYNFVTKSEHANDDHGHGTHVAGTIAQSTNNGIGAAGMAFDARLMPVKVLSQDGVGTTTDVADGIRWAADHGAQVINLSLGSSRNSRIMQRAIDHARGRGVTLVAAAGNSGGPVGYPGGSAGVIGVSALTPNDQLARFSSRGPGVDLAAPGVDVVQQTICNGGRDRCERFPSYNGTSMASPHVAGAAALLVSLGVSEPAQVEQALTRGARKLSGSAEGRFQFGAGALDAATTLGRVALERTVARLLALALVIFVVFRSLRRREPVASPWTPHFLLPALFAGPGLLFFAPFVIGRHNDLVDLLARPLPDWDILLGASLHGFLPLGTVLLPFGLTLLLFGVPRARPVLGGLAVGIAAYLLAAAVQGGIHSPMGRLGLALFAVANAVACVLLARLVLAEKSLASG
ncbi:MAG: S8 family peptidase [Polyangiaceae bacterium]|nr:S8 family peptidase [Polyangiaceae bacterium]